MNRTKIAEKNNDAKLIRELAKSYTNMLKEMYKKAPDLKLK
ncbi:MAG: hypothetical protein Nk1A_7770 [Endomicrobiia bacterium]|nr:MAG: hypothetical protein Nk1A_7770 [Endomicrobiia bacterium]